MNLDINKSYQILFIVLEYFSKYVIITILIT